MSDFKIKMQQIDFVWSSSPGPTGSLQNSPRSPNWNKGDLLLREEGRCRWEGEETEGKAGRVSK